MKLHDVVQSTDPKVMTAAGGSLVSWIIAVSEAYGPVVDVVAGIVAIGAGLMAIAWTAMKMYDRWKDRENRE